MPVPPTITFLSDYGHNDDFVGVCHGVMARITPEARIIDITHGVPRQGVRPGALILRNTLPYMPPGVHLAVVDPDVGAERRGLALRCRDGECDRFLVGPDNGLLTLAAERFGGPVEAVEIRRSKFRLQPASATFHGRDIFAPVAAHLAAGEAFAEAGDPFDPADLIQLELPRPHMEGETFVAHALYIDGFGNVQLDVAHSGLTNGANLKLGRPLEIEANGRRLLAWYAVTFADVQPGEALVYEDAYRALALAVNRGNAAAMLGLELDSEVRISPA